MDIHLITPNEFVAKIRTFIFAPILTEFRGRSVNVVVALSGGPDSTAMLVALKRLSAEHRWNITACHVNHRLRGTESDLDELFCRQLCSDLGVSLEVCMDAHPRSNPSEAQLRATRYDLLSQCALRNDSQILLLAHTQDDQSETMLFRVFRGTSVSGLKGMKAVHQMENGIWLIRPMLQIERKEVLAFLSQIGVVAREDSSNKDNQFSRNFLRNQVIPLCQSRFPSLTMQLERLRQVAQCEDSFMDEQCCQFLLELGGQSNARWPVQAFLSKHEALQRRAIMQALKCRTITASFERVETVLSMMATAGESVRISLDEKWDVQVDSQFLRWLDKDATQDSSASRLEFELKIPGNQIVPILGKVISCETWQGTWSGTFPACSENSAVVDLSMVEPPLVLRYCRSADTIRPLGMTESVTLKKYIRTHKSDDHDPSPGALVIADQGEVLWVLGVGLSDKIKVRSLPTHLININNIAADFAMA